MKARCIIIDDEHPARVLLTQYVSKMSQLELVGTFKNPVEALSFLNEQPVDIILLDIQMPELTGIEFLKSFTQKPKVILTTAYPNYALESYELDVLDYLLKPIKLERFINAINKALDLIKLEQKTSSESPQKTTISIKADHKIHLVPISEIKYIEGLREYVRFHLQSGEKIIALESLKKLESELPSSLFIRTHKSYIVNKTVIKSIYGNQLQVGEIYIPIGKSYRDEVTQRLT
ncbi:LytTR family DNA-binding domain-containing protein [Fulvivirga maritima]|uniref:LytR/AlgR family response regulator transcription factor n=1 Tax=Fulvivirga maritima TaxID=2904247 RepID=UPI001F1A95C1|nr:LytTR family DNA-binding domain-containing protein [Fulvivirga maritima]UII25490.1 LytTR family DNA-binding domain-containing protein [Fulvivirga maritima]